MHQDRTTQLILEGPVSKVLWTLATPNVLAVAVMTGVTFADAWYVGKLGTQALASLALVFPFLTLMQMMAGGAIGGGTTSAVARAVGAGDKSRAEAIAWHALLIALAMSLIYVLVLGLFAEPIFVLMGGKHEALAGAVDYAQIMFGGAAATWFAWVTSAIHRGVGDTVTPARAITVASTVQIALSGALTLGWLGLPTLGIAGPAVAWVLCQGVAAIYLIHRLRVPSSRLRLHRVPFNWQATGEIMRVGGPGLANSASMALTVVVTTGYIGTFGTEALAGYGLGARLELMLVPISFGVGAALTAAVGVNFGADQRTRARRVAWTGAAVTLVITGTLGAAVAISPSLWLDLFTADPDTYAVGMLYLLIAGPFYGFFGAGQSLYFASQGTGNVIIPVCASMARLFVVVVLGALAVAWDWGIVGLFVAVATGLLLMGLGQAACLFTKGWR